MASGRPTFPGINEVTCSDGVSGRYRGDKSVPQDRRKEGLSGSVSEAQDLIPVFARGPQTLDLKSTILDAT
jgi:hypothetical protein